ncbi:MAG: hypothetical protein DMF56_03255 [Acidobacteria bacterium]|nr:MAG: hypothetical protein DMF56_03255 [Acidobacteriota bacterium]
MVLLTTRGLTEQQLGPLRIDVSISNLGGVKIQSLVDAEPACTDALPCSTGELVEVFDRHRATRPSRKPDLA